jgi:hypothetical protein
MASSVNFSTRLSSSTRFQRVLFKKGVKKGRLSDQRSPGAAPARDDRPGSQADAGHPQKSFRRGNFIFPCNFPKFFIIAFKQ